MGRSYSVVEGDEPDAIALKAEISSYLRFERQYTIVGVEVFEQDVLAVTNKRKLIYVEVKRTISDLRADKKKSIHHRIRYALGERPDIKKAKNRTEMYNIRSASFQGLSDMHGLPSRFYFGIPQSLLEKAAPIVESLYPYAGIIVVHHRAEVNAYGHQVWVQRDARDVHAHKVGKLCMSRIVKGLSASIANCYAGRTRDRHKCKCRKKVKRNVRKKTPKAS